MVKVQDSPERHDQLVVQHHVVLEAERGTDGDKLRQSSLTSLFRSRTVWSQTGLSPRLSLPLSLVSVLL